MTALSDRDARVEATTVFDRNIVVTAGAGTGKTSLLVERVLNLIGSGTCELERLAAITFTEKAAAELRIRVAEGLEQLRGIAAGEREPDPALSSGRSYAWLTRERGVEATNIIERALEGLQQIDRARLLTIHAFCAELLRLFPVEARVDPDFRVDTGEQAELFRKAHWENFIESELGPEGRRHDLWNRTLDLFSIGELADAAGTLSDWRFPVDVLESRPEGSPLGILAQEAARSVAEIDDLNSRSTGMKPTQPHWFDTLKGCLTAVAERDDRGLARLMGDRAVTKEISTDRSTPGKRLKGVSEAEFLRVARNARQLARHLPALDECRFEDLIEVVTPFVISFREEFTRRGFASFDGLLALTRDLLRDHPEVRTRLKRRFQTLLVDEFQDTDPLQYEIVLLLGESPETSGGDPWSLTLEPGRLFVVGDPKQSIYRFRGADYDAYERAVRTILGDDARLLTLSTNFRSVPGVVEAVNALFAEGSTTCWRDNETQPAYEPIVAADNDSTDVPAVEIWTINDDRGEKVEARRKLEGRLIAEAVEQLGREMVPYRKISILFRTFASIPYYLRPLREKNIPFVVDGGKDFIKRPEIKQSLAILRTLAQPSDATALLAFLRSPAGGVPDTELATWAAAGKRWDWRHENGGDTAEACPRIAACFELLRTLGDETRHLAPDAAVRKIVDAVHLLPLAAAAFEGAQRVANLHKLVAAASTLTRDGYLSLEDLVDQIEEGGLSELEADSPLSDDDTDAVRITSIHKMKGLENDWVLLPDLARTRRPPTLTGIGFAVVRDERGVSRLAAHHAAGAMNAAWIAHHTANLEHEESEETRVLYVALTRAREKLVLVSSPAAKKNSTRWYDALAGWGYIADRPPEDDALLAGGIRHRLLHDPGPETVRAHETAARELAAVAAYDEAIERLHAGAIPPFRAPSSAGHEETPALPAAGGAGRDIGLAIGRVVHSALEHWDGAEGDVLRATARRLADDEAERGGVDRAALESEIEKLLDGFLEGDLGKEFATLDIVARELPLLLRDEGVTGWRGSIDLLYRDRGGLVVADYKTDRDDDATALSERYGAQLGIYARAVQEAMGLEETPRMELWLVRHGKRIAVSANPPVKQAEQAKRKTGPKRTKPEQQSLF